MSSVARTSAPELDWGRAVDLALHHGGPLRLAYQPIVDLQRGDVAGYEVLARFDLPGHPTSPMPWLTAAQEQGRLAELEQTILSLALAARQHLPQNTFMSVNLSAAVLLEVATSRVLAAAGDLRGLVVEITEHERVLDYDALRTAFAPTQAAGAMLGVDDAGSGYASLGHVLTLRPSFVKLDRSLVADLDHERSRCAAVAAIGALTGELDGWLVAEGIERAEELDALVDLEVPLGQGYLLGRPDLEMRRPPDEVVEMITQPRHRRRGERPVGGLTQEVRTRIAAPRERHQIMRSSIGGGEAVAPSTVVLVDPHGTPVALQVDGELAPTARRPMCVMPDEQLADVALRAAGRPAGERLHPLVCCDELGRAIGLLTVDRIMDALARTGR